MRTVGFLIALVTSGAIVWAQTTPQQSAPAAASVATGSQLFRTYCATCHGQNARGNGPLAEQLRHPPPDLTTFTARNGGIFPSARVHRIIDGRDVASHGDREMPIWGDAFRTSRDGLSADAVKRRIDALVKYLEAIQQRAAE
jgi:mono/diheme cytochrome c family protein